MGISASFFPSSAETDHHRPTFHGRTCFSAIPTVPSFVTGVVIPILPAHGCDVSRVLQGILFGTIVILFPTCMIRMRLGSACC